MRLCTEDDGVGLPEAWRESSLGLRLAETLARQIRGTATVGPRRGGHLGPAGLHRPERGDGLVGLRPLTPARRTRRCDGVPLNAAVAGCPSRRVGGLIFSLKPLWGDPEDACDDASTE